MIDLRQLSRDKGLPMDEAIQYAIREVPVNQLEYDRLKEAKDLLMLAYANCDFESKVLEQRVKEFIKEEIG